MVFIQGGEAEVSFLDMEMLRWSSAGIYSFEFTLENILWWIMLFSQEKDGQVHESHLFIHAETTVKLLE